MRRLALLIMCLVAVGCSRPSAPLAPSPEPEPVPASGGTVSLEEQMSPQMRPDQGGFRIEAQSGRPGRSTWVGPDQALVHWWNETGPEGPTPLSLVDLKAETVRTILTATRVEAVPQPEGRYVAVLSEQAAGMGSVHLLDLTTGELEAVYGDDSLSIDQLRAVWVGADAFVVSVRPAQGYEPMWRPWGKLLLVNVSTRKMTVLAEQGELGAVLKDGSLLVRHGWMDGELRLHQPPFTGDSIVVSKGGPWSWTFSVSPDGKEVAWLELEALQGEFTRRIPYGCCSGDPRPRATAITIWSGPGAELKRHPLTEATWRSLLTWRRDGSAILFGGAKERQSTLYELNRQGQVTPLSRHDWFSYQLRVLGESENGSLFYALDGHMGQNVVTVVKLHPDGRLETLREEVPSTWHIDTKGRLVTETEGVYTVEDVASGRTERLPAAPEMVAPGGRWVIKSDRPALLVHPVQ